MITIPQFLDFPAEGQVKEFAGFFLQLMERKSQSLYVHSQQVANYAACVAAALGLSPAEIKTIKTGAILHDIGHLTVPNAILIKAPYLNQREMAMYKKHPIAGSALLENLQEFSSVIGIVRSHHELWNGKGYPDRLKGVNIPLGARIVAVCDHYDRDINPSYSQWPKTHEEAVRELLDGAGTLFDTAVVKAFVDTIVPGQEFPPLLPKKKKRAVRTLATAGAEDALKMVAAPE